MARASSRYGLRPIQLGSSFIWLACAACGVAPSRAPLGGNYALPAEVAERRTPPPAASAASASANASEPAPEPAPAKPTVTAMPVVESAAAPNTDTVVYQPLKAGEQVQAEVALGFDAELHGGPPGSGSSRFRMDSKTRVALEISKVSAQSLDELELTVTTLSMHSEFAGHNTDAKPEPPEVYDVTLGPSPSIRARDGSKPDAEDRAMLLVLVAPLAEFHARWARSPSLDLKAGWSSKVPVSLPSFADGHRETVQVGPFAVRYTGRDGSDLAHDRVPFDVTLPVEYGAEMGKLSFDLSGKASLSKLSGRPTALELSGPFNAHAGAGGRDSNVAMSFTGSTRFSAKLSYPLSHP